MRLSCLLHKMHLCIGVMFGIINGAKRLLAKAYKKKIMGRKCTGRLKGLLFEISIFVGVHKR